MTVDMDVHYTLVFRVTSCAVRCISNKTFSVCFYQVKFFYVFPIRIPKISEIYNCVFVTQLATTPTFFTTFLKMAIIVWNVKQEYHMKIYVFMGTAVAQLVEALRYKSEGRGFNFKRTKEN